MTAPRMIGGQKNVRRFRFIVDGFQISKMILPLLLMFFATAPASIEAGIIPNAGHVTFARSGDVTLGAIFSIHEYITETICGSRLSKWATEMTALLMFAIEAVNKREDLLPNVTIGFDIRDDCNSENMALWSALALASTSEKPQEDIEFKKITPAQRGKLLGIIGTSLSSTSITATQAASLYDIPIISPFATSNELSDKSRFPYFLRTVAPDSLQASVIVDILLRFGWKYIGLYFHLNSYGIHGAQAVLDLAIAYDICVAFSVHVRPEAPKQELEEAILNLKAFPKVRVVVIFAITLVASDILNTINCLIDSPNITFIGSDGWSYQETLNEKIHRTSDLHGSIFIVPKYRSIPGFVDYYLDLQFSEEPFSPWFEDYKDQWMRHFGCTNLNTCPIGIDNNDITLFDAVHVFAYALQDLLHDRCNDSVDCNSVIQAITAHDFYQYLLNVTFEGLAGNYSFDRNGNPSGNYVLLNLRVQNGYGQFFRLGEWTGSLTERLYINTDATVWIGESQNPPTSLCREICKPGFIEVPLEQKCCLGCQRCPGNAVVVNGTSCEACPNDQWPDVNFIDCLPIVPTPPNWSDPVVIVILILSGFGLVLSGLAAVGLYYYRQNVLIKAASRELSSINILGLTLAFLSPFPLLVPPTVVSCRVSEIIVSLCITLTYAPTLLKVNRIYRIFEAGRKSNKCPRFIGSRPQLIVVLSIVAIMVSCERFAPKFSLIYIKTLFHFRVYNPPIDLNVKDRRVEIFY